MNKWKLVENRPNLKRIRKRESLWTQGNGYMGIRASYEEEYPESVRCTLINGVFDTAVGETTELAFLPDATNFNIKADGENFSMMVGTVEKYEACLDMQTGESVRKVIWISPNKKKFQLEFKRSVSAKRKHIMAQAIKITTLSDDAQIQFKTGIDGKITNEGVQHFGAVEKRLYDGKIISVNLRTMESGVDVVVHSILKCDRKCNIKCCIDRRSIFNTGLIDLKKGETVSFEKITAYAQSRDFEYVDKKADIEEIKQDAKAYLTSACTKGYDALLAESAEEWANFWEGNLVDVQSNDEFIDKAVIFAQYHLNIMASRDDYRLGIGAKALTGGGYMGHSFWDTEMFILPYFINTNQEVARRLLEYRYLLLDSAGEKAKKYGYLGAMYPWESAYINDGEVCLEYGDIDIVTGKKRKFTMAEKEIHITAGIAFAVWKYYLSTHDEKFMNEFGNEIIVLTGIFWGSRAKKVKGKYEILDVIGPDEYKEDVNNNAYTNYLAYVNLRCAQHILKKCPKELYEKLSRDYDVEKVKKNIDDVVENLFLPCAQSDGIICQFDGCRELKPIDITAYKKSSKVFGILGDYAFSEILASQVYKQADLIMLFYLLDEFFSDDCIKKNFMYYEERTLHDSSLSMCIHSIVAARIGANKMANDLFRKSCCVDLGEDTDNSDYGIHSASIAGIILEIMYGYGGLRIREDGIYLNPILPDGWSGYSFFVTYRGSKLKVNVDKNGYKVQTIYGEEVDVKKIANKNVEAI